MEIRSQSIMEKIYISFVVDYMFYFIFISYFSKYKLIPQNINYFTVLHSVLRLNILQNSSIELPKVIVQRFRS